MTESRDLQLTGDARLLFTTPARTRLTPPADLGALPQQLAAIEDCEIVEDGWTHLFKGSLTFHDTTPPDTIRIRISGALIERLEALASESTDVPGIEVECTGLVFADRSVSLAATFTVPAGWTEHRAQLESTFGPVGRDGFSSSLRELILDWAHAHQLIDEQSIADEAYLPYFNLTYIGESAIEDPGRAALAGPDLRSLVYPTTSAPLTSQSPLVEEYLYCGYAFLLLAVPPGSDTPDKLRDLLLILNVLYSQLASAAADARAYLHGDVGDAGADGSWSALERQLRMRHREVTTPTFSYDHHVLTMRNAILDAWGTEALLDGIQELLQWGHESQRNGEVEAQARRTRRMNRVLTVIGVLAVFDTVESISSLISRLP